MISDMTIASSLYIDYIRKMISLVLNKGIEKFLNFRDENVM